MYIYIYINQPSVPHNIPHPLFVDPHPTCLLSTVKLNKKTNKISFLLSLWIQVAALECTSGTIWGANLIFSGGTWIFFGYSHNDSTTARCHKSSNIIIYATFFETWSYAASGQGTCLQPQLPWVTYRGFVALEDIVAPQVWRFPRSRFFFFHVEGGECFPHTDVSFPDGWTKRFVGGLLDT